MNGCRFLQSVVCIVCSVLLASVASSGVAAHIVIDNPTRTPWIEAPVVLELPDDADVSGIAAAWGDEVLAVQFDDLTGDGKPDEMVFLPSIPPGVAKTYDVGPLPDGYEPPKRTHAGMYVEGFEGPGWESDRLAFRLYWDARNATDIFCKRKPVLGLEHYAKPEVDYHVETPWGMDVLKVGPALGAGAFGVWVDGKLHKVAQAERTHKVVADGPLRSILDLIYDDWEAGDRKLRLVARISSIAGQTFCEIELWLTPLDGKPAPELVTGLVVHPETVLIQDRAAGILGRWGRQALGPANLEKGADLGLGIVVLDPERIAVFGEDEHNSLVRLRGEDKALQGYPSAAGQSYVRYRVHANWEHEPLPARSSAEYEAMLRDLAALRPVARLVPIMAPTE